MEKVDLKEYQVIVTKPIFAGGKIWEPKVYDNPPSVLIECAKSQIDADKQNVYFGENGIKTNPFATVTLVGEIPPEDDGEDGDENKEPTGSEENEFGFVEPDDFSKLSKTEQFEYVDSIKDTPEEFDEAQAEKYEAELYIRLKAYSNVATGSKAIGLIEEVLALYE